MPVPPDPTATLYFTGLLAFCFDKENKHCQIGMHSKSKDHELSIRIVKKQPDPAIASVQTLSISHNLIRNTSDLWLDIEGETPPNQQTADPFIVGSFDEPPIDPQDFRHVIDLEGEDFYNRQLKLKSNDVLTPSLFLAKGLFYTAALTTKTFKSLAVGQSESSPGGGHTHGSATPTATGRKLGQLAEYIGANIYLDSEDQAIVLRAGAGGKELLRLKKEEGTTYEIAIENGPTSHSQVGNHFIFYYDAFELSPDEPKIVIELEGSGHHSIDSPPCTPLWLSKSHDLEADG